MGKKFNKKRKTKITWIFCEGKSEENYFKQLVFFERLRRIQVKNSKKTDPLGIVNEAIIFKESSDFNEGDELFCVFDLEYSKAEILKTANQLSKIHKIKLIESWPCFEYWVILHFEPFSSFISGKELVIKLKEKFKGYKKGHPDLYNLLRNKTTLATKNLKIIKKMKKNEKPHTNVNELVSYLMSLKNN